MLETLGNLKSEKLSCIEGTSRLESAAFAEELFKDYNRLRESLLFKKSTALKKVSE